ncbi:hypothetical protein VCR17J2_350363 [Vibrio coralliirubri]|nr:hypothetical protein VCR17J2_350363 [Vibrio coralliirubri]
MAFFVPVDFVFNGERYRIFLEEQKQQSDFSNERNRHHFKLCIETNQQLQDM